MPPLFHIGWTCTRDDGFQYIRAGECVSGKPMTSVKLTCTSCGQINRVAGERLEQRPKCGICGEPVDKTLTMAWGQHSTRCINEACPGCVPHPMRAEVDEIIPVSRGGNPYDRTNCRLAHRICNQRRGADTPKPEPISRENFPITTEW